jgi:hypothetical protein
LTGEPPPPKKEKKEKEKEKEKVADGFPFNVCYYTFIDSWCRGFSVTIFF